MTDATRLEQLCDRRENFSTTGTVAARGLQREGESMGKEKMASGGLTRRRRDRSRIPFLINEEAREAVRVRNYEKNEYQPSSYKNSDLPGDRPESGPRPPGQSSP